MTPDEQKELREKLRREILERTRQLAALQAPGPEFVPGKTPVRYAGRVYDDSEMTALVDSALDFWLTAGRWHRKLEDGLAAWYGVPHARLANSGSSANLLATAALTSASLGGRRLQRGDEIITVAAGFPTTVAPAMQFGLVPVFVDITIPQYNVDTASLEAALSPRTRAVMLAHTLGNPFDVDAVVEFCRVHDLWLVEDNCDAAGSTVHGRKTGTFGNLSTLSFYPPHHMTTGEGGAVLCSDDVMKRIVESLRDWGRDCWCQPGVDNTCGKRFGWQLGDLPFGYDHKYIYTHLGFNLKMTDMQAAVGVRQLEKLDSFVEARRRNWAFYREALAGLEEFLVLPEPAPETEPSWFGFMVTVRADAPFDRAALVRHLESRRIHTRMLFAGNLVRQPALTSLGEGTFRVAGSLRNTDIVMDRSFWIGVFPGLTPAMRDWVVESFMDFCRASGR